MKTDCAVTEIESMMNTDAVTVYNFILNNIRKQCYTLNGMPKNE